MKLLLAAPPPFLRRTLELTGLARMLPIRDSLAEALAGAGADERGGWPEGAGPSSETAG